MKFATNLVIAALVVASASAGNPAQVQQNSTEGSATSHCPNVVCPDVFDPVTDENGVTYPNKCAMEDAKCKGPRENVMDEYERVYGKKFGAPRDENDGVNSKSDGSDKCDDIICLQVVNLPMCGSDGVWYSNPCEFSVAACKKNIVEGTACN
ncbi:hypothetical protein P3T76_005802 [Phytophthora citrophthora]|uniref:Kazal-like domain-containing protein n=1 Tax=Phytophthora citrophthora TaxID=4793 RepID=A0AAD9GR38_9STRA|nr:hypothetical protein P3T76_005802 [Phytophthora citrophthora]